MDHFSRPQNCPGMYFQYHVYADLGEAAGLRDQVPDEPKVHGPGNVGISSRWWYLPGMYTPSVQQCRCCLGKEGAGIKLTRRMAEAQHGPKIQSTGELYRIPYVGSSQDEAKVCIRWPLYAHGQFGFSSEGVHMLELNDQEVDSLKIIWLTTSVEKQQYSGRGDHYHWKKTGLSRARYREITITPDRLPTARAKAAFEFLLAHNAYYKYFYDKQKSLSANQNSMNISSYDLFVVEKGIECAMFPHLYPTTDFTDTAILDHYQKRTGDRNNRVCSIGQSFTRKVLSSVRVYAEQRDLAFFLYEKHLAMKYFMAHVRAQKIGVTGDVMTRDNQGSTGYWEITQDALADLVRVMLIRCFDEEKHPQLYRHCRNLRGEFWVCAFPNVFITITAAEWKFPLPQFMAGYMYCCFAGAYLTALHMYFLVRCLWNFLANKQGHRFFVVQEWVMKTEYSRILSSDASSARGLWISYCMFYISSFG